MKNILLKIEYDGSCFSGWQRQPGVRTVQGELEQVLSELCRQPVQLDGTGRTDAGVHALGQCATFHGDFKIPTEKIAKAANDMLAESRLKAGDIRIISAKETRPDFHARFNAVGKMYLYRIFNSENMPVFLRNYRYNVKKSLDIEAMKRAAVELTGTHDFAAFMSAGSPPKDTTVRTIYDVSISKEEEEIDIAVTGNGFLYNMVRIITGTLLDIGSGAVDSRSMGQIISSCDRSSAGHTAPPQGLFMAEVYFDENNLKSGISFYHERKAGELLLPRAVKTENK